jgi:hypothetical protein
MVAVIAASSAALLGTSDDSPSGNFEGMAPSQFNTTYTFERKGVEGGSVDLTADQPHATFYINLRADDLGPQGTDSTASANITVHAAIEGSGFTDNKSPTSVLFKVNTPAMGTFSQTQALDQYAHTTPLVFDGDCDNPTEGDACHTTVSLEMSRTDEGSQGGSVHIVWTLDVSSTAFAPNNVENSSVGPNDPPWTIEVLQ